MTLDDLDALEDARVAAMLAADVASLERLFADDLQWFHASGGIDTKATMLAQFGDGSMRCFDIARSDTATQHFGHAAVVTGTVRMDVQMGGQRKAVLSRYSGLWSDHTGVAQLVHWRSARVG